MTSTPSVASVVVGKFDPARVFPPEDKLTVPLLGLMLATDDVRHANLLFVMANEQVNQSTGVQKALHGAQMWYAFRLLCSHLKEGALTTLVSSLAERRLIDLLHGRSAAVEALDRLRSAFSKDTFITRVRDSIGFHYQQADIGRVFERDLRDGRVEGAVVACQVGGLSRFTVTDVLALRLLDEAAGADLAAGGAEFAERGQEVTTLADDLSTFVAHLVDALLKEHGVDVTEDAIEVPPLLRAARDRVEKSARD
jgi:hypothetical protein